MVQIDCFICIFIMKYYFYCGVGAAKDGVWLTDLFFLIFGRGHIQIAYTPPVPTPPQRCARTALGLGVAMRCRS